jgi:hypothetical protein
MEMGDNSKKGDKHEKCRFIAVLEFYKSLAIGELLPDIPKV